MGHQLDYQYTCILIGQGLNKRCRYFWIFMTCKPNRHRHFCTVNVNKYRRNNIQYIRVFAFFLLSSNMALVLLCRLSYIYIHWMSAFLKAELRFPNLFVVPPRLLWINSDVWLQIVHNLFEDRKKWKKSTEIFVIYFPRTNQIHCLCQKLPSGAMRYTHK